MKHKARAKKKNAHIHRDWCNMNNISSVYLRLYGMKENEITFHIFRDKKVKSELWRKKKLINIAICSQIYFKPQIFDNFLFLAFHPKLLIPSPQFYQPFIIGLSYKIHKMARIRIGVFFFCFWLSIQFSSDTIHIYVHTCKMLTASKIQTIKLQKHCVVYLTYTHHTILTPKLATYIYIYISGSFLMMRVWNIHYIPIFLSGHYLFRNKFCVYQKSNAFVLKGMHVIGKRKNLI